MNNLSKCYRFTSNMATVDEEFIKDLKNCLEVADQLSKIDTEEAKLFVSNQLQSLHQFLQKKQQDAEDRIEEDMKIEEKEIEQLKKRIELATTSDGESESDVAYTDLNTLWLNLKEEYWQLAFETFIRETKFSVKDIVDILIVILKECFSKSKERASKSRTDLKFQVYYPGENPSNKNLKVPKEQDQNLENLCRTCQLKSTPFCIDSIKEAIVSEVKKLGSIAKYFKYNSKDLSKEIDKYVEKCVEFCWVACLEEPEIFLVTNPVKECKKIASEFIQLDSTIYKARKNAAGVEWPAIIQADKIRIQWQLYPISRPRPEPKDLRGEQSEDYRVAGIEDADGRLKDDPDDKIKVDVNATPLQSVRDNHKGKGETDNNTSVGHERHGSLKEKMNDKGGIVMQQRHTGVQEKTKVNENNKNIKGYKEPNKGHPNTRF